MRTAIGERTPRDSMASSPVAFAAVLAAYVVLGLFAKSLVLNWVIGPLVPLVAMYVLPHAVGRLRDRGPAR